MMIQLERKKRELEKDRQRIEITRVELIQRLKDVQKSQTAVAESINGVSLREQKLGELLIGMRDSLRDRGIKVSLAENDTILRIEEDELSFDLGSYKIPERDVAAVNGIGEVLLQWLTPIERRRDLDTVFIEGHTDAVPNSKEMGNWGLSTYRAISLWRYWTEAPGRCSPLKELHSVPSSPSETAKPLISVSGYGETRPTKDLPFELRNRDRGNPKDRRIDIRFTLVSIDKKPLKDIQSELKKSAMEIMAIIEKLDEDVRP